MYYRICVKNIQISQQTATTGSEKYNLNHFGKNVVLWCTFDRQIEETQGNAVCMNTAGESLNLPPTIALQLLERCMTTVPLLHGCNSTMLCEGCLVYWALLEIKASALPIVWKTFSPTLEVFLPPAKTLTLHKTLFTASKGECTDGQGR